jgi:dTDP-4-dehydrorhamnose reductase
MKILLIGKTGQLGKELFELFQKDSSVQCFSPDRAEFDLGDSEKMRAWILSHKPQLVINTAAFHNVVLCETEWENAFRINSVAVRDLAQICKDIDAKFFTFSTDYVFDGNQNRPYIESDLALPLQIYGSSKYAGECLALSTHPQGAYVFRTCGVYGGTRSKQKGWNFIEQRIREAREGKDLEISHDQKICPTFALDLAEAVEKIIHSLEKTKPGIYHLVNEGSCTWYEFTTKALELENITAKVTPVDRGGKTGNMRRPLYSVLENTKAKKIGVQLPQWEEGLKRYLALRGKL